VNYPFKGFLNGRQAISLSVLSLDEYKANISFRLRAHICSQELLGICPSLFQIKGGRQLLSPFRALAQFYSTLMGSII